MRQQPLPYRIALGGTLASFCLLFLFITGVLPMFYLIMPMLCSLLILIMAETTSPYWAFIMYLQSVCSRCLSRRIKMQA